MVVRLNNRIIMLRVGWYGGGSILVMLMVSADRRCVNDCASSASMASLSWLSIY